MKRIALSAISLTMVICAYSQGTQFKGLSHTATGSATLSVLNDTLNIENISRTGGDGVNINLGSLEAGQSLLVRGRTLIDTTEFFGEVSCSVTGVVDGAINEVIYVESMTTVTGGAVLEMEFPSFQSTGMIVDVFDQGQLVHSETTTTTDDIFIEERLIGIPDTLRPVCLEKCHEAVTDLAGNIIIYVVLKAWEEVIGETEQFTFTFAGSGNVVKGNELAIRPQNQAEHVDEMNVFNESFVGDFDLAQISVEKLGINEVYNTVDGNATIIGSNGKLLCNDLTLPGTKIRVDHIDSRSVQWKIQFMSESLIPIGSSIQTTTIASGGVTSNVTGPELKITRVPSSFEFTPTFGDLGNLKYDLFLFHEDELVYELNNVAGSAVVMPQSIYTINYNAEFMRVAPDEAVNVTVVSSASTLIADQIFIVPIDPEIELTSIDELVASSSGIKSVAILDETDLDLTPCGYFLNIPTNFDVTAEAFTMGGIGEVDVEWSNGQSGPSVDLGTSDIPAVLVAASDEFQSEVLAFIRLLEVDPTCGQSGNKILICHSNGNRDNELCVSPNAVQSHIEHGDYVGPCYDNGCVSSERSSILFEASADLIEVFPNPFQNIVNISIEDEYWSANVDVVVFDLTGKVVSFNYFSMSDEMGMTFELDLTELPSGSYQCRIVTDDQVHTFPLIKTQTR